MAGSIISAHKGVLKRYQNRGIEQKYLEEHDSIKYEQKEDKEKIECLKKFAKENNLTLDITYKETTDVEENIVLSQGRDPGDPIYNGYTLKITISKKPEDKTEPTDSLMPKDDKKDKKTE